MSLVPRRTETFRRRVKDLTAGWPPVSGDGLDVRLKGPYRTRYGISPKNGAGRAGSPVFLHSPKLIYYATPMIWQPDEIWANTWSVWVKTLKEKILKVEMNARPNLDQVMGTRSKPPGTDVASC